MKDRPQTEAGAGVRPDASGGNQLRAGAMTKPIHTSVPSRTDSRKWESFDIWLKRYERATGADSWHPSIPGGPRGWR